MEEKIERLATLDVERVVRQGRSGRVEENVRNIIVVELLECLGWDKLQGDLDFEHNVENKRADIALMSVDATGERYPKVIVECKDLDMPLDNYIDQAFAYAREKQVKWIILTNGIEIRLYTTFIENVPERKDRLLINPPIKLEELVQRFEELERWISKESIINRQLDFFTEIREREIRKKVSTNNLNAIFTEFTPRLMNYYRETIHTLVKEEIKQGGDKIKRQILDWLAYKGISFKDHPLWGQIYGKEAAFNLINRIFFLRICEDRQFSEIPTRLSKRGLEAWNTSHRNWTYNDLLKDSFAVVQDIDYESIYQKNVFDIIETDESLLQELVESFAEIDFRNVDSDILKTIYEEHISEEERKELGQYYTPGYIIRFILYSINHLMNLDLSLPNQEFMLLDPACGSGGFLIEAYDILKEKMVINNWDTDIIHETIINHHLFGLDIEPFAAQFASMNLLIKDIARPVNYVLIAQHDTLLAGGTRQTRLVPFKVKKIISKSPTSNKFIEKEFPLDNYDVVIGNPPYFLISTQEGSRSTGKKFHTTYLPRILMEKYMTAYQSWPQNNRDPNIFYLFVERGVEFLRNKGQLGYIIPDIMLAGDSAKNLRKFLLKTCKITKIVLIDGKVFREGGITNILLFLQKCEEKREREGNMIEIIKTSTYELKENDISNLNRDYIDPPHRIAQEAFYTNPLNVFSVRMTMETVPIFQNIHHKLKISQLVKLGEFVRIQRGIENLRRDDTLDTISSTKKTIRKLIAVDNIDKFQINWDAPSFPHKFVDYAPSNSNYRHIQFKQNEYFAQKKIVLKRVSNKLVCAYDAKKTRDTGYFYTMDSVQMIWLKNQYKQKFKLRVLVAILNSDLLNFYYSTMFSYKKLFSRVQKIFLEQIPIPPEINIPTQTKICNIVKQLEKEFDKKLERELNEIIYSLYFSKTELHTYKQHLIPMYSVRDVAGIGTKKNFDLAKYGIVTLNDLINCDSEEVAAHVSGVGIKSIEQWKVRGKELIKGQSS